MNIATALMLVTVLGNAPNPNLDASPAPANPPAQFTQPGPPVDIQIQHGAVDPRGTDAQPLAVRVVAMPPAPPMMVSQPPQGPPAGLPWFVFVFGLIQLLLMAAVIYVLAQSAQASRRVADAVERALARMDGAP
jgi:hypothetical protein